MPYIPTLWQNGVTPINEENLNKIETGIVNLDTELQDKTNELQDEINGKVSKSGWSADKLLGTDANGNVVEKDVEIPKIDVVDFVSLYDVIYGDKTDLRSKSLVAIMPTENDIGSNNCITVMVSGYEGTERWTITFTEDGLDFSEEQGYFPPFSVGCEAGKVVVLSKYLDIHETDTVTLDNVESNVAAKGLFDGIANVSTIAKMLKGTGKEEGASGLPTVSNEDDGKVLTVVDGKWGVADVVIPYSEVTNTAGGTTVNIG